MTRNRLFALAALAVVAAVALAMTGVGASPSFAGSVQPSDSAAGGALVSLLAPVAFVDANGNNVIDDAQPDETVYLDLDASRTASFGDLRLTGFLTYPAGSAVDFTNRDFGRILAVSPGWFAKDGSANWYLDSDANRAVSVGDVRITGAQQGTKVQAGNADAGATLTPVQEIANPPKLRVGYADLDRNNARDLNEAVYLDVDMNGVIDPGDLRFNQLALGADSEPTRAEFNSAVAGLGDRLSAITNWLVALTLVMVVGLLLVAWYARHLHRLGTQPGQRREPGGAERAR